MLSLVGLSLYLFRQTAILTRASGIGQTYWQVLAGRAISGIGGAGMTALVSIIITGGFLFE